MVPAWLYVLHLLSLHPPQVRHLRHPRPRFTDRLCRQPSTWLLCQTASRLAISRPAPRSISQAVSSVQQLVCLSPREQRQNSRCKLRAAITPHTAALKGVSKGLCITMLKTVLGRERLQGSQGWARAKRHIRRVTTRGDIMRKLQWCWQMTSNQEAIVWPKTGADKLRFGH